MSARQPEPERLEEIRARAEAATPGPWEHLPEYGPNFVGYLQGEHLRGVGDLDFGVGDDATADEAFTLHAREDVPALLAEIDRLRTQSRFLLEQVRRKDAASGQGDRALADFLAGHAPQAEEDASDAAERRLPTDLPGWDDGLPDQPAPGTQTGGAR